jgi:threonine dehydrogenase-like Zn-dependent dehydrogenase
VKAVVMETPGRVAVHDDWPEPQCGAEDVVVAVRGVGLCGSDFAVLHQERPVPRLPWVLGHEGFGTVVAAGAGAPGRPVGQRVVIEPNYPCLHCPSCVAGATGGCRRRRCVGLTEPGLLAERVAVPARFAWPVPDAVSDEDVVCTEPLAVALSAVRRSGVGPGQRCLVVGAGSQGLLVSLAVLHAGGQPFVADPHPGRVDLAVRIGARSAADAGPDELFPVVVETSGAPAAFEAAVERTAPGGQLVVVGQSHRPATLSTFTLVQRRLTISGWLIYDHPGGFEQSIAALGQDQLRPGRVLAARFGLHEAAAAFAEAPAVAGKSWISLP